MARQVWAIACLALVLLSGEAAPASKETPGKKEPAKAQPTQPHLPQPAPEPKSSQPQAEIWVAGKLFASLKRSVNMPFHGIVTQWNARPGQGVKAGDALARFRLAPEAALQLRRRLSAPQLKELEAQVAVLDKQLEQLRVKQRELQMLAQQNMATADSVTQIEREVQLLNRQRALLQERLGTERELLKEDQAATRRLLGQGAPAGQVPDEAPLTAPISGHVIWVNPDVRENAEIGPGTAVAVVAVTNPMRVRAQVHEIEAAKIKVGDPAELSLESLPGQKFQAKLVQIQWTSSTPALGDPSYYDVEFEVANPDGVLKEGLKASVLVRAGR